MVAKKAHGQRCVAAVSKRRNGATMEGREAQGQGCVAVKRLRLNKRWPLQPEAAAVAAVAAVAAIAAAVGAVAGAAVLFGLSMNGWILSESTAENINIFSRARAFPQSKISRASWCRCKHAAS